MKYISGALATVLPILLVRGDFALALSIPAASGEHLRGSAGLASGCTVAPNTWAGFDGTKCSSKCPSRKYFCRDTNLCVGADWLPAPAAPVDCRPADNATTC